MEAKYQKWLMFVVDGSTAMAPHWPTIFSNYINKIVRHSCKKWREPEAKCAKVELGLLLYNVISEDAQWRIQGSEWTTTEDEFLEKLSALSFNYNATDNVSSMTQGLAEALVMFPKPPIGRGSREYLEEGERHCILVAATEPSGICMEVQVPKFRAARLFGSHTEHRCLPYNEIAQFYAPLGVTLSVISPNQVHDWRELFHLGNNMAGADIRAGSNSADGLTVLISEEYMEARDALNFQESGESSSHQNPEPEQTTVSKFEPFIPSFFPDDDETNFLIWSVVNEKKMDRRAETPNPTDENQQCVELKKTDIINLSSDSSETTNSGCLLPEDRTNESTTSQLNTPAIQISPEARGLRNGSGCSYSSLLSLAENAYEEIAADLNARGGITKPLYVKEHWTSSLQQNILNAYNHNNNINKSQSHSQSQPPQFQPHTQHTMEDDSPIVSEAQHNNPSIQETAGGGSDLQPEPLITGGGPSSTSTSNNNDDVTVDDNAEATPEETAEEFLNSRNESKAKCVEENVPKPSDDNNKNNNGSGSPCKCSCADKAFISGGFMLNSTKHLKGKGALPQSTRNHRRRGSDALSSSSSRRFKSTGNGGRRRTRQSTRSVTAGLRGRSPMTDSVPPASTSASIGQPTRGPINQLQRRLPPSPSQGQPTYVVTWEGAISTIGNGGNLIFLGRAKAYRKATTSPTLTATWPSWLLINGVMARSVLNGPSTIQGPVDHLVFEMLTTNNVNDHQLFQLLSTKNLCAKFDLPAHRLILTPTNAPCRFIGTVFQGEFQVRKPTVAHSSHSQDHQSQPQQEAQGGATA